MRVEQLAAAAFSGHAVDDETARWVSKLDSVMVDKLSRVGLVPRRADTTLKVFLDSYASQRTDVGDSTQTVYGHTRRNLIDYFGPQKTLREITPGDADLWRLFLIEQGLADNTVRRRCGIAKQFITAAVRSRLVPSNPFADLKAAIQANPSRFYVRDSRRGGKGIGSLP